MFTITLLGVSAIVLGAAGETLWHVNASAASARSRTAGPMATVVAGELPATTNAGAIGTETEAKAAETGAAMLTTPIFKPFVMVRIPMPSSDYTSGEVMAVNESGQAVGWMHNDNDASDHPFFFDPASGVTVLDLPAGTDAGQALGLNDENPPLLVGSVHVTTLNVDLASKWTTDGDFVEYVFDDETPTHAFAVNDSDRVACDYKSLDEIDHSLVYEDQTHNWLPASTTSSQAFAVNADGTVVGWHMVSGDSHAYSWVVDTTTDIHPQGFDTSGATAINDSGDIAGWVEDGSSGTIPAYWYNTGSFYSFATPFPALGAESEVCDVNNHGEMVITRTDASGAAIWQVFDSEDVSFNLSGMTLMPDATGQIASARAINDHLWIGGSYKSTSQSNPVPCLIIPYDVNNNGEPDYREIVNGIEADTNANWLIDWAENISGAGMRVGLHAPENADDPEGKIDPVQVVRLRINIAPREGARPEGGANDDYIDEIVHPTESCQACQDFAVKVIDWGTGAGRQGAGADKQVEVIVRVHSMMGENDQAWGNYEGLPETTQLREEALEDIQTFGYRFAHCIDYLQWGNESFGGSGQYKFRDAELSCEIDDGTKFSELPGGDTSACKREAVDIVLPWMQEQMWAALEGSALAGRPLRMVTTGLIGTHVRAGYSGGSSHVGRYVVTETIDMANANQMYVASHVHYINVAEGAETIKKLVGLDPYTSEPWNLPNWRAATELGITADPAHQWFTQFNSQRTTQYKQYFFPNIGDPNESWDDYIDAWAGTSGQFGSGGPQVDAIIDLLADAGYVAVCYSALQYDTGTVNAPSVYLIEALRATKLRDEDFSEDPTELFTPIRVMYENAASPYEIASFSPHSTSCDPDDVCEGCDP